MKLLLCLISIMLTINCAFAQPGTVDKTFGSEGFVSTKALSAHYAVVQQPDGKLLTAGGYNDPDGNIARFLPNGTLDSSFGKLGFAYGGGAYDMVLQADEKILIVGLTLDENRNAQSFVARYKPDGILDPSFGKNGITILPDYKDYGGYDKIKEEPDGSIIISGGGFTNPESTVPAYSSLSRLTPDGAFDYNFGNNGRVLNYALVNTNRSGALAIQEDGKILQAGHNWAGGYYQEDYVLSRFNSDGTPDKSFGDGGTVISQGVQGLTGHDAPCGIVVQPDGKIVMGGTSDGYDFIIYMTALRYNTDGSIDKSFGTDGRAFVSFKDMTPTAYAILLQPDGKIILGGNAFKNTEGDLALCRLTTDGSLDSAFGIDGSQLTAFSGGGVEGGYCATLQQDGKIVLGGSYYNDKKGYDSYLLVRYNGDKGQKSLIAKMKHWLHNHGINWQGLPANIRYYSVQYSKTGSGFAEKGKVSATGSNAFQQYNFNVNDAGYYRIVAIDNKGYKTFSNKVMVTAADIASAASVYPNPAKDYVTVNGLQPNEPASISISNGSGAVLAKGTTNGGTQYRATTSGIKPGTYYINITTKNKTEALTFVKE